MEDLLKATLVRTEDCRLLIVPEGQPLPAGVVLRPALPAEVFDIFYASDEALVG